MMVFLSQDVRRWKGVSKEGGREWERVTLMNYLKARKGNVCRGWRKRKQWRKYIDIESTKLPE